MSDLEKMIRREIRRMAGTELKAMFGELRGEIAHLRRRLTVLAKRVALIDGIGRQEVKEKRRENVNIRALRRRLHLSKAALAELTGVHRNTVLRWERDGRIPEQQPPGVARSLAVLKRMTPEQARRKLETMRARRRRRAT